MAERRRVRRYNKRFKVTFGERDLSQAGFTANVSLTGMFIIAAPNVKLGQRMHVSVELEKRTLLHEAVVTRITVVPPELRSVVKGGFGVRFLSDREFLTEMLPNIGDMKSRILTYETARQLSEAYENELRRGGVFIWSETSVPVETVIPIEFELRFASTSVSAEAKVVTVVNGEGGKCGLACMFVDGTEVARQFEPFLPRA